MSPQLRTSDLIDAEIHNDSKNPEFHQVLSARLNRRSQWPSNDGYGPGARPRSATIVITKKDGGVIGS